MTARAAILTTALALALSGCGFSESRLNPFNWFGRSTSTETTGAFQVVERRDSRPLVAEVTQLVIERTPGGAIVRATGLPPEQGWYDAELVSDNRDAEPVNGVLTFSFHARPPLTPTRVSTTQSRELSVAVSVSNIVLAQVREIRVVGERNMRTVRR